MTTDTTSNFLLWFLTICFCNFHWESWWVVLVHFPVKRLFPFQRTTPRNCFQILGVDVLLDSSLQPCLGRKKPVLHNEKKGPGWRWRGSDCLLAIPHFTLQGINISNLGKRKIIFKMQFLGDMLVPWMVSTFIILHHFLPLSASFQITAFLVSTLGSTCPTRFLSFSPKDATNPAYDCPNAGATPGQ